MRRVKQGCYKTGKLKTIEASELLLYSQKTKRTRRLVVSAWNVVICDFFGAKQKEAVGIDLLNLPKVSYVVTCSVYYK